MDVQVGGVVVGDPRRDRVSLEQVVEDVDHTAGVVDVGRLEDLAQLPPGMPQHDGVAVGALVVQPRALGQVPDQGVTVGQLCVEQAADASAYRTKSTRRVYGVTVTAGRVLHRPVGDRPDGRDPVHGERSGRRRRGGRTP